jgi:hypothetical protein
MKPAKTYPARLAGLLLASLVAASSATAAEGFTPVVGRVQLPPEVAALPIEQAVLTAPPLVPKA